MTIGILIVVGASIPWIVSEYYDRRWVRLAFGACAILFGFALGYGAGNADDLLGEIDGNVRFGVARMNLLDTTIEALEAGKHEHVLAAFEHFRTKYRPTYEDRGHFDELAEQAVYEMRTMQAPP